VCRVRKHWFVYGLAILVQTVAISGIGLLMYLYSIASQAPTPNYGPGFPTSEMEGSPTIFLQQDRIAESDVASYHSQPERTEQPFESIQTITSQSDNPANLACASEEG